MSDENQENSEIPSGTSEKTDIIPGYPSMEQFTKDGFKILMEAIRHSNALPTGRDWNFYSVSESFPKIINDEGTRVLRLMNQIMRCNEIESNIRNRILDEKTELVIEANDVILEKVANNIDEMNGIRKALPEPVVIQTVSAELPINGSWNRPSSASITINSTAPQPLSSNCIKLITAKNIVRPQKFFKDKIDNSNANPWCPRIKEKPNSLKPLAIFLEEYEERQEYSHPYEFELDRFAPTPEQLLEEIPEFPADLSETPMIEIDSPEQLDDLVETLRNCKEFAVDLEHHSYRSFMGITCLMQISTKDKDYLIDTLALRDKLSILNEVFTKNTIVKIFHGADKDVEWLQRDLSIYVVNMFDTYQAAKVLQYSALSLAFLMKKFCDILPNKQFQLADWRIRPLPDEFKAYAREDTHYLIYIYKMLKKELLLKGNKSDNLLRSVIERSNEVCKKRYFKPVLRDDSHLHIYRRCKKLFDNRQLYALKEIYAWRDNLAREEDESLGYVLPNHMLLQISETLPREMQGILACCNPIPPLVRSHLLELHQIVLKAREQPLEKAILKENTTGRGVLKKTFKVNVDSALHCPHDLSKSNEFNDDLPTLLNNNDLKIENRNVGDVALTIEKPSSYSIFDNPSYSECAFSERLTFKKLRGFAYFSPYERYKLVKPFVEAEEKASETTEAAKVSEEQKQEEATKINEEQHMAEEKDEDKRTDDDRIASIRDHFLQLSKKFSDELEIRKQQEEQEEKLLVMEVEGSRKRKREVDEVNDDEVQFLYEEQKSYTPVKFRNNKNNFNRQKRKRKYNEINNSCNSQEHQDSQAQPQKKRKRNKPKKKGPNQNQPNNYNKFTQHSTLDQQQNYPNQHNLPHNQQPSRQKRVNQRPRQPVRQNEPIQHNPPRNQHNPPRNQHNPPRNQHNLPRNQHNNPPRNQHNPPRNQHNPPKNQHNQPRNQHNQPKNQQNRPNKQNKPKQNVSKQQKGIANQGQGNFVPYDYSSVDFRQFQGGAGSATSAINIKSKFKAKGRKKIGNKGNKSSTFGGNFNRVQQRGPGKNQ